MTQPQLQYISSGSLQLLDAWFQLTAASQLQLAQLRGTGGTAVLGRGSGRWVLQLGNVGQKCLSQLHRMRQT